MPPSSIIVSFDVADIAVSRSSVSAAGEKNTVGLIVSVGISTGFGRIETVKVPRPILPDTSVAVAVQMLVVF